MTVFDYSSFDYSSRGEKFFGEQTSVARQNRVKAYPLFSTEHKRRLDVQTIEMRRAAVDDFGFAVNFNFVFAQLGHLEKCDLSLREREILGEMKFRLLAVAKRKICDLHARSLSEIFMNIVKLSCRNEN